MKAMRFSVTVLVSLAIICFAFSRIAYGGMPRVLPEDLKTIFRLEETPNQRLTAISFFLLGVVLSAAVVRLLWNALARDFKSLPRLTYFKSLALVILWGLLFIIVLTMISGARELMTPGAWKKQGITYTLDDSSQKSSPQSGNAEGDKP